jgi:hypothetical protein
LQGQRRDTVTNGAIRDAETLIQRAA